MENVIDIGLDGFLIPPAQELSKKENDPSCFSVNMYKNYYHADKQNDYGMVVDSELMRFDFPMTQEGAIQALFTNYVQSKRLRETVYSWAYGKATENNQEMGSTYANLELDNAHEYQMGVSLANYRICLACCDFHAYEEAVYKYEELLQFGAIKARREYELQMRSLAKSDYHKSNTNQEYYDDFMEWF